MQLLTCLCQAQEIISKHERADVELPAARGPIAQRERHALAGCLKVCDEVIHKQVEQYARQGVPLGQAQIDQDAIRGEPVQAHRPF